MVFRKKEKRKATEKGKKTKKKKKHISEKAKKSVLTSFILLFPSMMLAGLSMLEPSIPMAAMAIALFFYQAVLIKNFIDDHYKGLR